MAPSLLTVPYCGTMQVLDAARYAIVQQTRKYDWLSKELAEAKQDVRDARGDDDEDDLNAAKEEVARLKAEFFFVFFLVGV